LSLNLSLNLENVSFSPWEGREDFLNVDSLYSYFKIDLVGLLLSLEELRFTLGAAALERGREIGCCNEGLFKSNHSDLTVCKDLFSCDYLKEIGLVSFSF
jgi:hypothetical protein